MTNNMDFTIMLGNVISELEPEFKLFHTQEEAKELLHTIMERAKYINSCIPYETKNSMIDSYIIQQDKRLRLLFNEAANDCSASNEKRPQNY